EEWSGSAALIGKRFWILRGDTRWSLLETEFPYKFIEIMRGEAGKFSANGISRETKSLSLLPVKLDLERYVASADEPLALGNAVNVPAVLIDSATNKYRFSSGVSQSTNIEVRD